MSWRVARSLDKLLAQLNAAYPNRNKASDGSIGDASHQTRDSDHNPWYGPGIVTARDFTHDPAHGADMGRLSDELVATRDPRIKYVIFNRLILDSRPGNNPWHWVRYNGQNPHTKHMHVSVMANSSCDSTADWHLHSFGGGGSPTPPPTPQPTPSGRPTIKRGDKGAAVTQLQNTLNRWYPSLPKLVADGDFGPATEARVKYFQSRAGLTVDGVVGPRTWAGLGFQ